MFLKVINIRMIILLHVYLFLVHEKMGWTFGESVQKYKHTVCTYIDSLYIYSINVHTAHTVECSDLAGGFQSSCRPYVKLLSLSVLSLCEHKQRHILMWDVRFLSVHT